MQHRIVLGLINSSFSRDCSVNINDLRGGQRHDMWLSLQNIKMGRLRLAVTILEENVKVRCFSQRIIKSIVVEGFRL